VTSSEFLACDSYYNSVTCINLVMHAADEELEALLDTNDDQSKLSRLTTATKDLLHFARGCKKRKHLLTMVPATLLAIFIIWFVWVLFRNASADQEVPPATVPINLRSWFNNQGVTWMGDGGGGFDGKGSSYRAEEMPITYARSSGVTVKPFPFRHPETICD